MDDSVLAASQILVDLASGGQFLPDGTKTAPPMTSKTTVTPPYINDVLPAPADPDQHFLRALGQWPYKQSKSTEVMSGQDGKKSSPKHQLPSSQPVHVPPPAVRISSPVNSSMDVDVVETSEPSPGTKMLLGVLDVCPGLFVGFNILAVSLELPDARYSVCLQCPWNFLRLGVFLICVYS